MNYQTGRTWFPGYPGAPGALPTSHYVEFGTGRVLPVTQALPAQPWPATPPRRPGG